MNRYIKFSFLTIMLNMMLLNIVLAQYQGGQGRGDVKRMSYVNPSGTNVLTLEEIAGPYCAGATFDVYFYNVGIYDISNVYSLELSDENGDFAIPTIVGTLTGNNNVDTILATLPTNLVSGTNYLLRVTSSSPVAIGTNSNAFSINEILTPSISISTNQSSACQGTTMYFNSNIINGGTNPAYQWFVNGVATGTNNPNFNDFLLNDGDIITCELTSSEVCVVQPSANSNPINLTIFPIANTGVTISASQTSFCAGTAVYFIANDLNGGSSPVFQWYVNGNPTAIGSFFNTSSLSNGDTVNCLLSSSLNCAPQAASNDIIVTVTPNNFSTTFVPSSILLNSSPYLLTFSNVQPTGSQYNLVWSFGDGSTAIGLSPSHNYISNGFYDVSLIATDTSGCSQTYTYPSPIQVVGSSLTCNHNANLNQTGNITGCIGGNVSIEVTTNASNPTYQWTINGVNIGGATQSTYNAIATGNYAVIVYEAGICPVISNIVSITFTNPVPTIPTITEVGNLQNCGQGNVTLTVNAIGAVAYLWNTGDTSASINVNQSGNYYVTATFSVGCQSTSTPFNLNATGAINPGICMVSVDSLSNSNLIIWEVPVVNNIDSFLVYRESPQANVYEKIGAVDYFDLSEFIDLGSNPQMQSYRYKLAVLDTCGGITNLSDLHKTIHLQIFPGTGNNRQLSWTNYEGINVTSYEIYRKFPADLNFQLLTTIAGNLTTFTDINPAQANADYRIEIVLPQNCNSSDRAAYGKSKSNVGSNQGILPAWSGVGIQSNIAISQLIVYPNPSTGIINLEWESATNGLLSIKMINTLGQAIYTNIKQSNFGKNKIELETNLAKGIYLLEISDDNQFKKLMKVCIK